MSALIRRMAEKRMPRAERGEQRPPRTCGIRTCPCPGVYPTAGSSTAVRVCHCRVTPCEGAKPFANQLDGGGIPRATSLTRGRGGSSIGPMETRRLGTVLALALGLRRLRRVPRRLCADAADPALDARLRNIETAFRDGDAAALRVVLPGRREGAGRPEGPDERCRVVRPGQLEVVFARIFEGQQTREFGFRKEDVTVSMPGTAFARGRAGCAAAGPASRRTP